MFLDLRTTLKKLRNQFRRNGSVHDVTKEAEMIISRGSTKSGSSLTNPVFGPASEPPAEFSRKTLSSRIREFSKLRFCISVQGKCLFNSVVSPSGSSSSPTTSFHIKALTESTSNQALSEYNITDVNRCFTVTSLLSMEDQSSQNLIQQTNIALRQCPPKLCALGTGGVYFIHSNDGCGNELAVFKPTDEEPGERNNPKGYQSQSHHCDFESTEEELGSSLIKGFWPGEGAMREWAAYILDYSSLCGIPATTMVVLKSLTTDFEIEKIGSLQQFIPHDFDAEESGPSLYPVEEVHKICLADIRFVNKDRNGQNILVSKRENGDCILTPIDHGYCFPDNFNDIQFAWTEWRQAKQTFGSNIIKFIETLDPKRDLDVLFHHGIELRPECIRVFLFSSYFLKWCVRHRYTPRDIAVVMSSTPESSISQLENVYQEVLKHQELKQQHHNDIPFVELELYQAFDRLL